VLPLIQSFLREYVLDYCCLFHFDCILENSIGALFYMSVYSDDNVRVRVDGTHTHSLFFIESVL